MGKIFKYIGWAFLGVLVFIAGTIGVLFITGAFKDETIYLESITFDEENLITEEDLNSTTLSKINDVVVANDNFDVNINFTPATATTRTLSLSIIKGHDAVSIPKTATAGEPFTIEILKEKVVTVGSLTYYIIDNVLVDSNQNAVTDRQYEIYEEFGVIKIDSNFFKIKEYNIGGEVKIQAVDSEGGTTWSEFSFFVDSGITNINYDFSTVPGELEDGVLVFSENSLQFKLTTTPRDAINPSTGEIYQNKFSFKNILTESSDENVIKITNTEKLESRNSEGDLVRSVRYTFKTLKAGTTVITSKTLPTYQMYLDYVEADTIFNNDIGQGFMAVTTFANKYLDYILKCGEVYYDEETGEVSTTGFEFYKNHLVDGRFVINSEAAYTELMQIMFITTSQEITVENVELTNFVVNNRNLELPLFEDLLYNGRELNRQNLKDLFEIELESTSTSISQEALSVRLDQLRLFSIKYGEIFDSIDAITGDDLVKFEQYNEFGELEVKTVYSPIQGSDGVTRYLTYKFNDSVLKVQNPTDESNKVWKITANKEQTEGDGTGVMFVLQDEVSKETYIQVATVNIKVNNIIEFSLNQNLIKDMSINVSNNYGEPNIQYVDLRLSTIGQSTSLIKTFTENASYNNIKLFVSESSAKINGFLKIRVKTKNGQLDGEPMSYTLTQGDRTIPVYEIDYTNDSSGRICIEALNASVVYNTEEGNELNPIDSFELNEVELYVAVVRTNVDGVPIDAEGNFVDEKYATGEGTNWEYKNVYDIIQIADETIKFSINSYLQSLQFYTANDDATGGFENRTTVDGQIKLPTKMIVGQTFTMFVTNASLDGDGYLIGNENDRINLNTALFNFWFNNLRGQTKNARFQSSNPNAVTISETLSMVNGLIKITVECLDATSSVDIYVVVDEEGNTALEGCRANLALSFATVAQTDGGENDVFGYYSAGASENLKISNGQNITVKGYLQGTNLLWQYFEGGEGKGEFKFGGSAGNPSIDYNVKLNLDNAYIGMEEKIVTSIKDNAIYEWTSYNEEYVTVSPIAGQNGYNQIVSILKGTPEGVVVRVSCSIKLYEASNSSDIRYKGTQFVFDFYLTIIQSEVSIEGYSTSSGVWQINDSPQSGQRIEGGDSFDILAEASAPDTVGGSEVTRRPIVATIDNVDITNSLTFTIVTYDETNSNYPIYFMKGTQVVYSISGVEGHSLRVYAKPSLTNVSCAIKISTYNADNTDFTYYITVVANATLEKNFEEGKNYLETSLGANNKVLVYGNENANGLNDYFKVSDELAGITLTYSIVDTTYARIEGNKIIPTRVSPTKQYETVRLNIGYNIIVGGETESYIYETATIRVLPYYTSINLATTSYDVQAGVEHNLFGTAATPQTLFNIAATGAEIDDLNDILRVQIISPNFDDSAEVRRYINIFGEDNYNTIFVQQNGVLNGGEFNTNKALTTNESVRYKVYFKETNDRFVELTSDEQLVYINVLSTITYSTLYDTKDNALPVEKTYSVTASAVGTPHIEINYSDTIVNVYGSSSKITLTGGDNSDVFSQVINNVVLKKYTNGAYDVYTGDRVELIVSETFDSVDINYLNSVNEIEYYSIVFVSINGDTYNFHFKLEPNITISKFYPVYDSYENVIDGTQINLESNYIKQNKRLELSYNDVILDVSNIQSDVLNNTLKFSVSKTSLVGSTLITAEQALAFGDYIDIVVNGTSQIFTYEIIQGSVNAGLQGSVVTFDIKDTSQSNCIVKVTTFNGATTEYNFVVNNALSTYNVTISNNSTIFAENEFSLSSYIEACKRKGDATNNFNALRIIVKDFNGTTLKSKNADNTYSTINIYDQIGYSSTLKFDNVGVEKEVIFILYTLTSVDGVAPVQLIIKIKPNVAISVNNTFVPAGVSLTIANATTSPLTIKNGVGDAVDGVITYSLVDVVTGVTLSGNTISSTDINENRVAVVEVKITFANGEVYIENREITFVPNIRLTFDYAPSNTKTVVAAPLTKTAEGSISNRKDMYLWDEKANSSTYPITITDLYGNSILGTSTDPVVSFEVASDEHDLIYSLNSKTGALIYQSTNEETAIVKINVHITWASGVVYTQAYNITFKRNIATEAGITVRYTTTTGGSSTKDKPALSIYGGSTVSYSSFLTTDSNFIAQEYNNAQNMSVKNAVSIKVYDSNGNETIGYIKLKEEETDFYKVTATGIEFKAVSQTQMIEIPYYINVRNTTNGVSSSVTECFAPANNGTIKIELLSVISAVATSYNDKENNPYPVIVKANGQNVVNLYELLNNVVLVGDVTFDSALATTKVLLSKNAVAELFTMVEDNNYARLTGQTIVFNLDNSVLKTLELKFTVEGISEPIVAYAKLGSNASLQTVDTVKTFTYDDSVYYVVGTDIYDYKADIVGDVNGEAVTINGISIDIEGNYDVYTLLNPVDLTFADGTKVLGIYKSDVGTIDLSTLVYYVAENKFIEVDTSKYYIVKSATNVYKLLNEDGTEFTGTYNTITADSTEVVIVNGDTETSYEIQTEEYNISKAGLVYGNPTIGENDKYIQNGNLFTFIPYYSTNVGMDKQEFMIDVSSNNNNTTSIAFYVFPVETSWTITYDGEEYDFDTGIVAETPAAGSVREIEIEAVYGTSTGSMTSTNVKYSLPDYSENVSIVDNILYIDYSTFSQEINITINFQTTFNGGPAITSNTLTIHPLIAFSTTNRSVDVDPENTLEVVIKDDGTNNGLISYVGGDITAFELSNSDDSKYVTISSDIVTVSDELYLLENKEVTFNVTYQKEINSQICTFNSSVALTLKQNTTLVNLFESKQLEIDRDADFTTINESNPISVQSIDGVPYDGLTLSVELISGVCGPNDFATLEVEASIVDGVISITYGNISNVRPETVFAKIRIKVSNGAEVIYTSGEISIDLVSSL